MNNTTLKFPLSAAILAILWAVFIPIPAFGQTVIIREPDKEAGENNKTGAASESKTEEAPENPEFLKMEREAFDYLNSHRIKSKQKPLIWNDDLAKLARKHSKAMATKSFFSINGPNGETIEEQVKEFGITKWINLGRMIAANAGKEKPVETAIDLWISSKERRQYLFDNPWSETGVGIYIGDDGMFYLTQDFMTK
ncbi:MAG: CAP domain-containing protein [Acidobacteria bacterium]|nr:CAP domain-containing protein [Acidobacteriota bacterium]